MGRQSSRLYFQGKDHKDIYFQGHYHDAMYITDSEGNATLVWEKLKDMPLEGFTGICYYNGYYYVAYCTEVNPALQRKTLIYQGKTLDKLEYACTIKNIPFNIFVANEHGITLAVYSKNYGISGIYRFDYLENKKINTDNKIPYGDFTIDNPINIGMEKNDICFLYRKRSQSLGNTPTYAYTTAFTITTEDVKAVGNGGFSYTTTRPSLYQDTCAVFVYDDTVIFPLMPVEEEFSSFDFIVKPIDGTPELKKVKIPYNVAGIINNYNIIYTVLISNNFLIYKDIKAYINNMSRNVDIKIDLRDFSVTSFVIKEGKSVYNISKFIADEYCLCVFSRNERIGNVSSNVYYMRYILEPEYDSEIRVSNIKNIELIGNNTSELENRLVFSASYRKEKNLYFSIYSFDNYLLEINMENNTAAIIQPKLYLKER